MLGTTAKKLRMLGFDSMYHSTIDDDRVILIAKKENRIIITKDHALAVNSIQHDITTIQIHTHTEKEQLIEIANAMNWKRFSLDVSNARCSLCNGVLESVPKQSIMDKILPRIAESVQEFWKCNECGHIYWAGTHIRNLEKLFAEINDKL
ncbi:MAG: Mut7-C RNAse domain-containing protein [Thaumarchaeota archaeon]|nr:Mut7-C RNAse domain-containing protein [Nitrososphaerota archaeon]